MGLSEVVDTLTKVSSGASAVKTLHDTGKSFSDMYGSKVAGHFLPKPYPLTAHTASTSAKVDQPVRFWGTGTGLLQILSATRVERELPIDPTAHGEWATILFFSKPGVYDMSVKDNYSQIDFQITVD